MSLALNSKFKSKLVTKNLTVLSIQCSMGNIRAEEIQWNVDSCHALAMQMRKQDYHCSSANSIFWWN